jgi:hypothetical protein
MDAAIVEALHDAVDVFDDTAAGAARYWLALAMRC